MNESVRVLAKNNYGRDMFYPANANATKFAHMLGTKTLTSESLGHISGLGYKIEVSHPEVTFS